MEIMEIVNYCISIISKISNEFCFHKFDILGQCSFLSLSKHTKRLFGNGITCKLVNM